MKYSAIVLCLLIFGSKGNSNSEKGQPSTKIFEIKTENPSNNKIKALTDCANVADYEDRYLDKEITMKIWYFSVDNSRKGLRKVSEDYISTYDKVKSYGRILTCEESGSSFSLSIPVDIDVPNLKDGIVLVNGVLGNYKKTGLHFQIRVKSIKRTDPF